MDQQQRRKVLEEAMKHMTPSQRQQFIDDYTDYSIRKEVRSRRKDNGFKPINFNDVLGHLKR